MPNHIEESKIKELQEECRIAYNRMAELRKKRIDQDEDLTAEEEEQWGAACAAFDSAEGKVRMLREEADRKLRLEEPVNIPANLRGRSTFEPAEPETRPPLPTSARYDRGIRGWISHSFPKARNEKWEKDALRCGIRVEDREIDVPLLADPVREVRAIQKRADLDTGTASEGSEWISQGFVYDLEVSMQAIGGLRDVATILRTTTGNALPWPTVTDVSNAATLVTEAAAVTTTADPTTGSVTFNAYKLSSKMVKVSAELIQDSAFPISGLLARLLGERLARGINTYCTTGTGSSQPNGIVTAVDAAGSGVTAASATALDSDEIFDLEHTVDPAYRSAAYNCCFMMHDGILKAIRKLKDGNDQYLWAPGLAYGVPSTLLNWPYTINQGMASALAASAKVLLFGAMSKYVIREVAGIRLHRLVELYRGNDQEAFIAFMRIDGDLLDAGTNPIELLTMAAS